MKEIKLNSKKHPGLTAKVDNADYKTMRKYSWTVLRTNGIFYAISYRKVIGGYKRILMHREILQTPKGMVSDHVDGDGLNNQKSNLRICTVSQNGCNSIKKKKKATSKYKGVFHGYDGKYHAHIRVNKISYNLGKFETEIDAAIAYNKAALEKHKEFARINIFPDMP